MTIFSTNLRRVNNWFRWADLFLSTILIVISVILVATLPQLHDKLIWVTVLFLSIMRIPEIFEELEERRKQTEDDNE